MAHGVQSIREVRVALQPGAVDHQHVLSLAIAATAVKGKATIQANNRLPHGNDFCAHVQPSRVSNEILLLSAIG